MIDMTCSYCQMESVKFEVSGMRKFEGDEFTRYQLCKHCNSMLASINPRVEVEKRKKVWNVIWQNVQQQHC